MEEIIKVNLSDKREIILQGEDDISISLHDGEEIKCSYSVPYPSCGYGGGTLLLSPTEQYLLFAYYSGESDEAFMLFRIAGDKLELVYESACFFGEDANYCFNGDENCLMQALRTGWWCADEVEVDEAGKAFYEFGKINVLDIKNGVLTKHSIYVYPSSNWVEDVTDNGAFRLLAVMNDSTVVVSLPWENEEVTLLPDETGKMHIYVNDGCG